MFLLSRLDEVSRRFPDDVERTRAFLLDRGIPAGSLDALTHFSARLVIDPSFQRDVTSLVQVVIRRENEAVDYMDLLGILVVAAAWAGPFDANDEHEESLREMLRFLTQVPRPTGALGPVFVRSQNVVPLAALAVADEPRIAEPAPLPLRRDQDVMVRPVPSMPFYHSHAEESKPSPWRGGAVWVAGVTALAVALGSGWMFYQKNRTTPQTTAALRTVPPSSSPVPEEPVHEEPVSRKNAEPTTAPADRVRKPQPLVAHKTPPAVARRLHELRTPPAEPPVTERATQQQAAPVRPLPSQSAAQSFPPVKATSPTRPAVVAENHPPARPSNPAPDHAATTTPPASTATTDTPSVRRRLPKWVDLNAPPLRRPGGVAPTISSAPGVVHPASIGMMATNLISSPAPEYPAAASQARVQGEVTVRAVVDRNGNVTDARVISGPELLRDVSLEAVQHWRFRPYMQGGKPVEVATTAVLDFELP